LPPEEGFILPPPGGLTDVVSLYVVFGGAGGVTVPGGLVPEIVLKLALTDLLVSMSMVVTGVTPDASPDQPVKVYPVAGVANRVTTVPAA
jgi:hypothetical protein